MAPYYEGRSNACWRVSNGVVYIATGSSFVAEAIQSAESVKAAMPDKPVTMYSDRPVRADAIDSTHVRADFEQHRGDSIIRPDMMPYQRNLFLDTDTFVCTDLTEMFDALERFDILVAHSPGREAVEGLPACMAEFNTGVIAYRRTPAVAACFDTWMDRFRAQYDRTGSARNQASFTRAVWEVQPSMLVLPPEYNVRVPRAGYLNGPAKIVHGRHWHSLESVAARLNATDRRRVYYRDERIGPSDHRIVDRKGVLRLLRETIDTHGLRTGLRLAYRELRP